MSCIWSSMKGWRSLPGSTLMPKRAYLAAYTSSIGERGIRRFMATWFQRVRGIGLLRSGSLDLDFHSVPANSEIEGRHVVVTLDKRAHNPYLVDSGLADQPTTIPWLGHKALVIQFA